MVRMLVLGMAVACTTPESVTPTDGPTNPDPTTAPLPPPTPTTPDPKPTEPKPEGAVADLTWAYDADYLGPFDVSWTQTEAAEVVIEYAIDGSWQSTPPIAGTAGPNQATVVGVPLGYTAPWRIVVSDGSVVNGPTPFTALPIPDDLPTATVLTSEPTLWEPTANFWVMSINQFAEDWGGGVYWLFVIDRQARPVWATRTPLGQNRGILYAQISQSGDHILWDEIHWGNYAGSVAHRTYLDDPIADIDIPGHHHALIEHPDGTLAWGGAVQGYSGTEILFERAPGATEVDEIWRCSDWTAALNCFGLASNSIWYDPTSETYLYSWWSMESVIQIQRSTGEADWWSRGLGGGNMIYGLDGEYGFDPPNTRFRWQHGLELLPNGNLLASTDENDTTWVREYEIDDTNEVLREVWSFDSGIRARFNGDTRRLPNGNTFLGIGAASQVFEVTSDQQIAWRLRFSNGKMLGRADMVEDLYTLVAPR